MGMTMEEWNKLVDQWVKTENARAGRVYKPSVGMYPPRQEGLIVSEMGINNRLASADLIAHRRGEPDHGAGHRREQGSGRDVRRRIGEPRLRDQRHRAERGVHVHQAAVAGDLECPAYPGYLQLHPIRAQRHQPDVVPALDYQPAAVDPVTDVVPGIPGALRLGRHVPPAQWQPAEHPGVSLPCRSAGQRRSQRR